MNNEEYQIYDDEYCSDDLFDSDIFEINVQEKFDYETREMLDSF